MERIASATIAPAAKSLCLPVLCVALNIFVGVHWAGAGIRLSSRTAVRRSEQLEWSCYDPEHAIFAGLGRQRGRIRRCSNAWDYLPSSPWSHHADRTTTS